ncbi:hypothetical protein GLOIN_2v1483232 [Rhizophagus irregularis DAOM 181602=DAOM 197198]|nr:hypothetical protein GLOIN_2v1483232 [Rhizophagus irregularis DAOM 181602=DAOM 197198]
MCESVLYKCEQLPLNEAFEFIDDQLDQDEFNKYNANSNDNQIDMSNQNKEKIENIEDYYDFRQIYLKALISSVLRKSIKELMPIRWLHDSVWNCIDSIFDEPLFIGKSSKSLNQIQVNDIQKLNFIPRHHNNIQEVQIWQHIQKKLNIVKNKGRPNTKRFKTYNEEKNKVNQKENVYKMDGNVNDNDDNVNRRKCDLCHKMGHYTSKYPNKRNS